MTIAILFNNNSIVNNRSFHHTFYLIYKENRVYRIFKKEITTSFHEVLTYLIYVIQVEPVEETERAESLQYNFETIRVATDQFSEVNKLGQGGFGAVYKARIHATS